MTEMTLHKYLHSAAIYYRLLIGLRARRDRRNRVRGIRVDIIQFGRLI